MTEQVTSTEKNKRKKIQTKIFIASGQGTMYVEYKGLMTHTAEGFKHLDEPTARLSSKNFS
jgi:hypothetical protein